MMEAAEVIRQLEELIVSLEALMDHAGAQSSPEGPAAYGALMAALLALRWAADCLR